MDSSAGIAYVLIVAFVIDRVVSGALFVLVASSLVTDPLTIADTVSKAKADRAYKLIYFCIAAVIALVALATGFAPLIATAGSPEFRRVLTFLVLIGGAERLGAASTLLNSSVSQKDAEPDKPIQITGKLTLEEGGVFRIRRAAGQSGG